MKWIFIPFILLALVILFFALVLFSPSDFDGYLTIRGLKYPDAQNSHIYGPDFILGTGTHIKFWIKDPPEKVFEFYKQQLTEDGWELNPTEKVYKGDGYYSFPYFWRERHILNRRYLQSLEIRTYWEPTEEAPKDIYDHNYEITVSE